MVQFCRGSRQDKGDILDFANYVFSQAHGPHDFQKLLPKVYAEDADGERFHYLVKDDGRIKAMVCVLPVEFKSGSQTLKAGMLGTVSVHPYSRGEGYMKKLMDMAVSDMKAEGYAFSALGGQRQRYEYFGYEPCGAQLDFTVTATNVRHYLGKNQENGISFTEIQPEDGELLDMAFSLYQKRAITGRKRDAFYRNCLSWQSTPYAVMKCGRAIGYLCVSPDRARILEIELTEAGLAAQVLAEYFRYMKMESVLIPLAPFEREKIGVLSKFCESYSIATNECFQIFDYRAVFQLLFEVKSRYENLKDGRFRLEIEGETPLEIQIEGSRVTVAKTDEIPDLMLSRRSAMGLLCSPIFGYGAFGEERSRIPAGWFPLPLHVPSLDSF